MKTIVIITVLFAAVWWLGVVWFPCVSHGHTVLFCAANGGKH